MDTWGKILRRERTRAGMSMAALAKRVVHSKAYVGHVETGLREPSLDFARACDEALGTAPLLTMLLGGNDERDDVKRRAMWGLMAAAGAGAVTPLSHLIRSGLWEELSGGPDYDGIVKRYARQFVVNSSPEFGESLRGQILVLSQVIREQETNVPAIKATARLSELYGLWRGNMRDYADAAGWYATAVMLANRSGDPHLEAFIEARTGNRVMFEGAALPDVKNHVERALSLTKKPSPGRVEARAAQVCIGALTGDVTGGRRAMAGMYREIDKLPEGHNVGHLAERAIFHEAYLESRVGTLARAERACEGAFKALADLPYWLLEARLYWARARVVHGDVQGGLDFGVDALQKAPETIGVIKVAARDLLCALPQGVKHDGMPVLRVHSSTVAGPWETL